MSKGNLVLSRKKNETIIVAVEGHEPIEVTVVEIRGDRVRIGLIADRQVVIHRKEVWDAIQREKAKAS